MLLGKVIGTVVASRKEPSMDGLKFLEADLPTPVSGGVGAWAKSDTVVLFDSFSVDPTAQ